MNKKNILIFVVFILLVLGAGFFMNQKGKMNKYSVVYLTTGEVYVGKLSTFPSMELKNAYILQVTKDPADSTKNTFQLNPIDEALWAPEVMRLNQKNVVFYGPLSVNSKIAQTLAEKGK